MSLQHPHRSRFTSEVGIQGTRFRPGPIRDERSSGMSGLIFFSRSQSAILLGIAHGIVSPAMFMCVGGILYDRYHTRVIRYYRGLTQYMPVFSFLFFLFILGNMSTPLTVNWAGELMALMGSVQRSPLVGIAMSSGIVFSAAYSIWLYARLCNGSWSPYLGYAIDVTRREFMVLLPLLFTMFLFGLFPNIILTDLHYSVSTLLYE